MSKREHIISKLLLAESQDSPSVQEGMGDFFSQIKGAILQYKGAIMQQYQRLVNSPSEQEEAVEEIVRKLDITPEMVESIQEAGESMSIWEAMMITVFGTGLALGVLALAVLSTLIPLGIFSWLFGSLGKGMVALLLAYYYKGVVIKAARGGMRESSIGRDAIDNAGWYSRDSKERLSTIIVRRSIKGAFSQGEVASGIMHAEIRTHSEVCILNTYDQRGQELSQTGRLYGAEWVEILVDKTDVSGSSIFGKFAHFNGPIGEIRDPIAVFVKLQDLIAATGLNEEELGEKQLTYAEKKALPTSAFVFPEERKYPIHDIAHARNALARVSAFGTEEEKAKVRAAVYRRYPSLKEAAGDRDPNLTEEKMTYKEKKSLPASSFVYPGERKYPIHDIAHARNALARVSAHGTPAEKERVRAAVHRKYPSLKEESMDFTGVALMEAPTQVLAFAKKTGRSVTEVERLWTKAKEQAAKQGKPENWAYVVGILKKMLGIRESLEEENLMEAPALIASFAKKTGKSKEEVERLWNKAKDQAEERGRKGDWAYVVGILKRMLGIRESFEDDVEVNEETEYAKAKAKLRQEYTKKRDRLHAEETKAEEDFWVDYMKRYWTDIMRNDDWYRGQLEALRRKYKPKMESVEDELMENLLEEGMLQKLSDAGKAVWKKAKSFISSHKDSTNAEKKTKAAEMQRKMDNLEAEYKKKVADAEEKVKEYRDQYGELSDEREQALYYKILSGFFNGVEAAVRGFEAMIGVRPEWEYKSHLMPGHFKAAERGQRSYAD